MTASATAKGLARPRKPPYVPVPGTNAIIEIAISRAESQRIDHGPAVRVRCGTCAHRLFDLRAEPDGMRSLVITRMCPNCHRLNTGRITRVEFHPLEAPDAPDGPWRCPCDHGLGLVDAVRGRITVRCRCKTKTRVAAADAIGVADRENR
jgi:hypothetical protein